MTPEEKKAAQARASLEAEIKAQEQLVSAAERMIRSRKAQSSLLDFTHMMMPRPDDPDNSSVSLYEPVKHHRILAAALESIQKGEMLRLIITMPPRHGKTELASKKFIPWFIGKNPQNSVIFATYNQEYAEDIGRSVRNTMRSPIYRQVFPNATLRKGSAAADRIETDHSGLMVFVGQGGALTGRGAHCLLIDDPVKGTEDAASKAARDRLWDWFTRVAYTRLMDSGCSVVIIMTRWHEDDIVGRLTDPRNEHYRVDEAKRWKILSLPAIAVGNDPMGRQPGEALWPERFPVEYLENVRTLDSRGFSALFQGNPTPDDGDFFKKDWLKTYKPDELPKNLRIYVASDHAVSTAQNRDATVMIPVGVDENNVIWVLPDVWWRRADTDDVVDAMLDMMKRRKPLLWFAEKGHITKSIGPFLRKRMVEEEVYCAVQEVTPARDKQTRAQSIRGRMSMGRVRFPAFAPWWSDAQDELLKFPNARHDDFVDTIAWIGLGLAMQVAASTPLVKRSTEPRTGSMEWVKMASKYEVNQKKIAHAEGY